MARVLDIGTGIYIQFFFEIILQNILFNAIGNLAYNK